jgi:hypothetical protein
MDGCDMDVILCGNGVQHVHQTQHAYDDAGIAPIYLGNCTGRVNLHGLRVGY